MAQHTAVNVWSAADALAELISSPELRTRMGAAGRQRARERFTWQVVAAQYTDLFAELGELRARAKGSVGETMHRVNPLQGDPSTEFRLCGVIKRSLCRSSTRSPQQGRLL